MICKSMRKKLPVAVPSVQMKQVSFAYEPEGTNEAPAPVLQNVDLSVRQGECVVLCGRSGCGKTTLLRLVNGLVPHFYQGTLTGEIRANGLNTAESDLPEISRIVGSVFQNPRTQFFHTDTTGEMAFNLENQAMPREQMQQRLHETADQLELGDLMDRNIFELSGGEKQQIACGSVYASMPDVVVMDEPSSNLDMPGIRKLQNNIRAMKEAGKTILISEHRLWYLEQIADLYLYVENGRIAREFSPGEIVRMSSKEREAMGLRAVSLAQLRTACIESMVEREWNHPAGIPECHLAGTGKENGLEAHGLTFSFGERQVLNVRHLAIPKGAIVAVIGGKRCGKIYAEPLPCRGIETSRNDKDRWQNSSSQKTLAAGLSCDAGSRTPDVQ
ncbi:MAG: ABC transporter ATP-binding protein [Lachnospiraceae bacterium]|nr:ABC transporter ATP-binding protein [Lachnospiraceae bacterium]